MVPATTGKVITSRFNVAALSQPTALFKCATCVPAALNVKPFQVYGNWDGQILKLFVDALGWLIVKLKVAVLSQPLVVVVE